MKNLIYTLVFVFTLTTTSSCSFLDVEQTDVYLIDEYYSNKAEINMGLNGVYSVMTESALYGLHLTARTGLWADLGYNNYSVDRMTVAENATTATDPKVRAYWQACYKGINRANLVISNINKPTDLSSDERKDILGQAKFLRAYYYLLLTTRFGDVPMRNTFIEEATAEQLQIPQVPSAEVYQFIINEMKEASDMVLPADKVVCAGRVSKSAVWGVLARACLYNAGYPNYTPGMYAEALNAAKKVIDTGLHSLNPDYKQVFINYMQDKYDMAESIFEVEFWGNDQTSYNSVGGSVGRGMGPRNRDTESPLGYCIGTVRATGDHYRMYDNSDVRRDWNIADYYYDATTGAKLDNKSNEWQRYAGKFRREYELVEPRVSDATPTNFPILRYSDVLLMFAEAYAADPAAEVHFEALAYECLNKVRRRGHNLDQNTPSATVDISVSSDKGELLYEIQNERARELAFEMLRKDDLVRWNIFYETMKGIHVPDYTSSYYVYARRCFSNVARRDVLWPIPVYEMSVNSKLKQNPGW